MKKDFPSALDIAVPPIKTFKKAFKKSFSGLSEFTGGAAGTYTTLGIIEKSTSVFSDTSEMIGRWFVLNKNRAQSLLL